MKRIYYFLTLLLLASAPAMLTSCDPDDSPGPYDPWYDDWRNDNGYDDDTPVEIAMAQTLNGSWTGTVTNEYTENGKRVQTTCYVDYSFVQYTANSSNGNGYETDYVPATDDAGNPVTDDSGNIVYNKQTLPFTWSIDSRSYSISLQYTDSGMSYVINTDRDFFLGWDDTDKGSFFEATMEGVNNDERAVIRCQRVTASNAPAKDLSAGKATSVKRTFGKTRATESGTDVPMALHRR